MISAVSVTQYWNVKTKFARVLVVVLLGSALSVVYPTTSSLAVSASSLEVLAAPGSTELVNTAGTDSYTVVTNNTTETFTITYPLGQVDTGGSITTYLYTRGVDINYIRVIGEDTLTVVAHLYSNETATVEIDVPIVSSTPIRVRVSFVNGSNRPTVTPVSRSVEAITASLDISSSAETEAIGDDVFIRTTSSIETITLSSLNGTADFWTLDTIDDSYQITAPELLSTGSINYQYRDYDAGFVQETATIVVALQTNMPMRLSADAFQLQSSGRGKIQPINIYLIKVDSLIASETTTVLLGGPNDGDGLGVAGEEAVSSGVAVGENSYSIWLSSTNGTVLLNSMAGRSVGAVTITSSNPETATASQVGSSHEIRINGVDTGTATFTLRVPGMAPATFTVSIEDNETPVITAAAGTVRVDALGSWTGLTATASDNDGLVNLTSAITARYQLRGEGAFVSLESATALLATVGETVTVTYDVIDHAGIPAQSVTAVFTSVAVPAPVNSGGGGLTYADEEKIRLANEKAAAEKLAAEKAAADAAAAEKLAAEKAAAERAATEKALAAEEAAKAAEELKAAEAAEALVALAAAKAAKNSGRVSSTAKSTKLTLDLADEYFGSIAYVELLTKVKSKTRITVLDYFVIGKENGTATSILKKLKKGQRIQVRIDKKIVFRATI